MKIKGRRIVESKDYEESPEEKPLVIDTSDLDREDFIKNLSLLAETTVNAHGKRKIDLILDMLKAKPCIFTPIFKSSLRDRKGWDAKNLRSLYDSRARTLQEFDERSSKIYASSFLHDMYPGSDYYVVPKDCDALAYSEELLTLTRTRILGPSSSYEGDRVQLCGIAASPFSSRIVDLDDIRSKLETLKADSPISYIDRCGKKNKDRVFSIAGDRIKLKSTRVVSIFDLPELSVSSSSLALLCKDRSDVSKMCLLMASKSTTKKIRGGSTSVKAIRESSVKAIKDSSSVKAIRDSTSVKSIRESSAKSIVKASPKRVPNYYWNNREVLFSDGSRITFDEHGGSNDAYSMHRFLEERPVGKFKFYSFPEAGDAFFDGTTLSLLATFTPANLESDPIKADVDKPRTIKIIDQCLSTEEKTFSFANEEYVSQEEEEEEKTASDPLSRSSLVEEEKPELDLSTFDCIAIEPIREMLAKLSIALARDTFAKILSSSISHYGPLDKLEKQILLAREENLKIEVSHSISDSYFDRDAMKEQVRLVMKSPRLAERNRRSVRHLSKPFLTVFASFLILEMRLGLVKLVDTQKVAKIVGVEKKDVDQSIERILESLPAIRDSLNEAKKREDSLLSMSLTQIDTFSVHTKERAPVAVPLFLFVDEENDEIRSESDEIFPTISFRTVSILPLDSENQSSAEKEQEQPDLKILPAYGVPADFKLLSGLVAEANKRVSCSKISEASGGDFDAPDFRSRTSRLVRIVYSHVLPGMSPRLYEKYAIGMPRLHESQFDDFHDVKRYEVNLVLAHVALVAIEKSDPSDAAAIVKRIEEARVPDVEEAKQGVGIQREKMKQSKIDRQNLLTDEERQLAKLLIEELGDDAVDDVFDSYEEVQVVDAPDDEEINLPDLDPEEDEIDEDRF